MDKEWVLICQRSDARKMRGSSKFGMFHDERVGRDTFWKIYASIIDGNPLETTLIENNNIISEEIWRKTMKKSPYWELIQEAFIKNRRKHLSFSRLAIKARKWRRINHELSMRLKREFRMKYRDA